MSDAPAKSVVEKTPSKSKKETPKKGMNKTWLIVGVLVVLVLGGINIYYMKKNKELKEQLAAANKDNGVDIENRETDETDAAPQDKEPSDGGSGSMGDPE